jgi:hypothetical protein
MIVSVKKDKNKSNRWSENDLEKLRKLHGRGLEVREIADKMGRTYYSISKKISLLGLTKSRTSSLNIIGGVTIAPSGKGVSRIEDMVEKVKAKAKGYSVVSPEETSESPNGIKKETTRDKAKSMTKVARQIARVNGKRITMAMFFVEDL